MRTPAFARFQQLVPRSTPVEDAWAKLQQQYPALTQGVDFGTLDSRAMNAANTQTLHLGVRNQGVVGYGASRYQMDNGRLTSIGGMERVDNSLVGPRAEFVPAKELGQANYGRFMTRAHSDLFQDAYGLPRGRPWMAASAQGRAEQHLSGTPRDLQGAPEEFDPRQPSPGGATSPQDLYGALFAGALGRVRPEGLSTVQLTGGPLDALMRAGVVPKGPGLAYATPQWQGTLHHVSQPWDEDDPRWDAIPSTISQGVMNRTYRQPQMTGAAPAPKDVAGMLALINIAHAQQQAQAQKAAGAPNPLDSKVYAGRFK